MSSVAGSASGVVGPHLDVRDGSGYLQVVADEAQPEGLVVFQVLNHDRSEMFFGVANTDLRDVMGEIAGDKDGPAKDWKQGELVQWRPLTDFLPESQAMALAKELESRSPPNKFTVIPYAR
jgi:hypothetical protein